MKNLIITIFILVLHIFQARATIHLPSVFGDNMVLQQQSEVLIWGTADLGEKIIVKVSWDQSSHECLADEKGKWGVEINTPQAGGPYTLSIIGSDTITYENVMIGEVWLCTGQSNMEFKANSAGGLQNAEEEVAAANYPNIRFFKVDRAQADKPKTDCNGQWQECSPETMKNFSSVAYFFGRELHGKLNVPIGLIQATWGGTSIELWTRREVIYNDSIAHEAAVTATKWPAKHVSTMFNAMINPVIPFKIAGNIWYQGETNRHKTDAYAHLMELMITDWRELWGYDFPFYYVQIAPFGYDEPFTGSLIREQQLKAMRIPNSGMVVTTDVGNPTDVHPKNKQVVGHRLALWALAKTYGIKDLAYCGPLFKSMEVKDDKAELAFDYADSGLQVKGDKIIGFEVAGDDQLFYPAKATIQGEKVLVNAKQVKKPVAVRFGFNNISEPNLYNAEGLPVSPFRTDDWFVDIRTEEQKLAASSKVPENSLAVTYVGNEGFLLQSSTKKVLFDALFTNGYNTFAVPSKVVADEIMSAKAPFNDVDLCVLSHYHADHCNSELINKYLSKHQNVPFVASKPSIDFINGNCFNFVLLKKQFQIMTPEINQSVSKEVSGISIKAFGLKHLSFFKNGIDMEENMFNVSHLLEMDGIRVFHSGDIMKNAFQDYIAANGKWTEPVDVAFLYYKLLESGESDLDYILSVMNPKFIVLMHIPPEDVKEWTGKTEKLKEKFSNIVLFKNSLPMDTKILDIQGSLSPTTELTKP